MSGCRLLLAGEIGTVVLPCRRVGSPMGPPAIIGEHGLNETKVTVTRT